MKNANRVSIARKICVTALAAATVECGKLALSFLPNVETVTLLCALYGYAFGACGVFAALLFVCMEPLIYGFSTWVISYFLYWPLVSAVFWLLAKMHVKNRFVLTGFALLLTAWFGVLTSLVDVGLFTGFYDRFFYRFGVYYLRGVVFYAVQTVCNAVLFTTLFPFLEKKLRKVGRNYLLA